MGAVWPGAGETGGALVKTTLAGLADFSSMVASALVAAASVPWVFTVTCTAFPAGKWSGAVKTTL